MDCRKVADEIAVNLQKRIASLPEGFYGTFQFTQTGNNLTHPITWGLLSRILWDIRGVASVGIDVRFNLRRGCKFQPDLVGFDADSKPVVFVDYESPNSSDARVPWKDVDAYATWRDKAGHTAPYVVVTTLPDRAEKTWELRYASGDRCNAEYRGRRDEVRSNPCRFWYKVYSQALAAKKVEGVALVNIDGTSVRRRYPR